MSKVYLCCSCVGPDRLPLLVTSKPYEHGDLHVSMCHVQYLRSTLPLLLIFKEISLFFYRLLEYL